MFRIKALRENRGITMAEAARLLKMPYTTYVNYEKGLREPTSEVLIQLADFYDTSVDHIVGRSTDGATSDHLMPNFSGNIVPMCTNCNVDVAGKRKNVLCIASRDGSYEERFLTDEQLNALKAIIDQLPDASDDI